MTPQDPPGPATGRLRVLVVDDERPALDELAWLLERDPRVAGVATTDNAAEALRVLQEGGIDAVFIDIRMPGLTGLELARVLSRFRPPPPVVFVTAHDDHAVDAFELNAVDYLLKPVREDRLAEAVRRVVELHGGDSGTAEDQIPVELGGVTRFVARSDVHYVEAHGDYARLHTADGSHLVRIPLTTLESAVARGRLRAHPPLAAGRAAPRRRGAHGRRPLHRRGRRRGAAGEPAAHPRAARPAGPPGPAGRDGRP